MSDYITYRELQIISQAEQLGMSDVLINHAKEIQKELGTDGDEALWEDCLEMAYNELIVNRL